ncbi:alginate lyase family protein [Massilia horti]|uniref:Alginate lyase n=1 Tax=Massilia horti TaxID=2562153 RepID=A0A4Y9T3V1_9BURK|nr:alginate lyase family protein [Massilia horti]TFW34036.1 alginate lyase [Massilia horti]
MSRQIRAGLLSAGLLFSLGCGAASACNAPPPAVIDIDANSYYTDSHHSIIDPARKARNEAATKPVNDYLEVVARAASNYQAKQDRGEAQCALAWLASWADHKAMLGKMTTEQSFYTRKWTLAGLALSYARVKPAATPAQQESIEGWFKALADGTIEHSEAHKGNRNNHYYWEGLAVAAAGAVTHEERHLAWGRKVFDHAMGQVADDGSLPLEMARASRALSYHSFSAAPLVMLASVLNVQSPKLDKLVKFTLDGTADPAIIQKMNGFAQEHVGTDVPGWAVIHARHAGKPVAPANGKRNWNARMGGDLNLPNPLEHPAAN